MVEAEGDRIRCVYCGKTFDSEQKKGEHVAENHVTSDKIRTGRGRRSCDRSIVEEWSSSEDGE